MKPSDALSKDWRMYYNNTWMLHETLGVGKVQVLEAKKLHFLPKGDVDEKVVAKPDKLSCWWPRSGSYNTPYGAVYIARRAARNMRKSACWGDHYQLLYGTVNVPDPISLMANGPDYIPTEAALDILGKNVATSIAVSRDIILARGEEQNTTVVVFRGIATGELTPMGFDPYVESDPVTKRAYYKLMKEGVI